MSDDLMSRHYNYSGHGYYHITRLTADSSHLGVLLLLSVGPVVQAPGQGEAEAAQDEEHADH